MNEELIANNIIDIIKNVIQFKKYEPKIGVHEPYFDDTNALKYVKDCIDTNWVSSTGKWVERFEKSLCEYTGAKYAIAVTNGTVALRLALHLVGVKVGDEVLIPPLTFVATANAISHLGAFPHFVDINKESLGLSSVALKKRLEEIAINRNGKIINRETGRRIAAILPVHIFGNPANILELKKISNIWDIPLIEDASEALGSWVKKSEEDKIHCGLIGDIGTLSFNGNKIITTGGGGALITNNQSLAKRAYHLSRTAKVDHKWELLHDQIGWNDRMPNINAALGVAQIEKIESILKRKKILFKKYKEAFNDQFGIKLINSEISSNISNNWLISIRCTIDDFEKLKLQRLKILEIAHKEGILLRPVWRLINKMEIYKNSPKGDLSEAINQEYRLINLPSSPQLIKTNF